MNNMPDFSVLDILTKDFEIGATIVPKGIVFSAKDSHDLWVKLATLKAELTECWNVSPDAVDLDALKDDVYYEILGTTGATDSDIKHIMEFTIDYLASKNIIVRRIK